MTLPDNILYTVKNSMQKNAAPQFSQQNLTQRGAALQSPRPLVQATTEGPGAKGATQLSSKMGASSQETQASSKMAANGKPHSNNNNHF